MKHLLRKTACSLIILTGTVFNIASAEQHNLNNLSEEINNIITLEKNGKIKLALKNSLSLYKIQPNDDSVSLSLGRLYVKNGQPEKAIEILQPQVLEHTNDWRPWFWTGTALLLQKDFINASLHIDEALSREGENAAIWVQRALIEQARGNNQSAINILEVANNIEQNRSDVLLNLAYNYEQIQERKKAKQLYRQFLSSSSQSKRYAPIRAEIVYRLAQYQ